MKLEADYRPEFESLKGLLLAMAQERSVDVLLRMIVDRLAKRPHVALARIWLMAPGDLCAECYMRADCRDQTTCLHLAASAGRPEADPSADWSRITGRFRRIPVGAPRGKVGQIAATRQTISIEDIERDSRWIADPAWAQREGIRGFAGQPLVCRDELLGVLAVFTRIPYPGDGLAWLRLIADHAATAITNARAFEEIENLRRRLEAENIYLQEEIRGEHDFEEMIGESPALRAVQSKVQQVACTDATVLIQGETGTGKELVARAIHSLSARRDRPLVKINCAAISAGLVESELFGHVKGAFTGALERRQGRFELADGGTLFLDEVTELPVETQAKLLRVLQENEFEPVGSSRTLRVNVRIIAATNRELEDAVQTGRLREDLFYRLNVFPLVVPALRERRSDIPRLATFFLARYAKQFGKRVDAIGPDTMELLVKYRWPGNVRELQNVIERAVVIADTPVLRLDPELLRSPSSGDRPSSPARTDVESLAELERRHIVGTLERTGGVIQGPTGAARLLGLHPNTLRSRMKKLGIRGPGHDMP